MSAKKIYEKLSRKLEAEVSRFRSHTMVEGHPEMCGDAHLFIQTQSCLMGSPESSEHMAVTWSRNLGREQTLRVLKRAQARITFSEGLCAEYGAALLRHLAEEVEETGAYNSKRVGAALERAVVFMEFDLEYDRMLQMKEKLDVVEAQ